MFCTRCGQSVTPGAAFCSRCGQPLPPAVEPPQSYPVPPQGHAAPPQSYPVPPQNYAAPPQGYIEPPQGHVAPPQSYAVPSPSSHGFDAPPSRGVEAPRDKKKKAGMIVGIAAGAVALLVIAAVLLFVWPGLLKADRSVAGIWYSETRGEVIRFGSGRSFDAQTPYGDFEGKYAFDARSGEGRIEMKDGREFDFVVDRDRLSVDNMGTFDRADDDFDTDGFLEDAGAAAGGS